MSGSTLYALSSGRGAAGVAVVRVSGPEATAALLGLTPGRPLPAPRRASLRTLHDPQTGEAIDRGLVLLFPAPVSFTGEDVVELHVHGGPAVMTALLDALGSIPGLAAAGPGTFTRRAFDNGKLDLTAVEGLADLIAAETQAQRRQALRQLSGVLGDLCENWRARLIQLRAKVEAEIEFGEDEGDVPQGLIASALPAIAEIQEAIAALLAQGNGGQRVRDGLTVVVLGAPNVGKSSLINALAKRDVAIVTDEAGTTRDLIEVWLDLGGYPVCIVDTAGLREGAGPVEAEGIRRACARAAQADLVLALSDGPAPWPEPVAGVPLWRLRTKADLGGPACGETLALSAATGQGMAALVEQLRGWAEQTLALTEAPALTRSRHREALMQTAAHLERGCHQPDPALMAEDLRLASRALGRITGQVDVEDMLDALFASFCIGK